MCTGKGGKEDALSHLLTHSLTRSKLSRVRRLMGTFFMIPIYLIVDWLALVSKSRYGIYKTV